MPSTKALRSKLNRVRKKLSMYVVIVICLAISIMTMIMDRSSRKENASMIDTKLPKITTLGTKYYISPRGNNADGLSWKTAWNELDQIKWNLVQPGDALILDGGENACDSAYDFNNHNSARPGLGCGMLYRKPLTIGASGTHDAPITVMLSDEKGHNGTAVIFGGRSSMLPYCNQAQYEALGSSNEIGITIGDYRKKTSYQFVRVDGVHRSGIMVYGNNIGVAVASDDTHDITLRNLEVFDNGTIKTSEKGYRTDSPGISIAGTKLTLERLLVHDNGQDQIQDGYTGVQNDNSHAALADITVKDSWLYNRRNHPAYRGYPFNTGAEKPETDCTHVDGLQIWGGGLRQSRLTVENVVWGPLLSQAIYPGDDKKASFDTVTVKNNLFLNPLQHTINGARANSDNATPSNWNISNITSYLTNEQNTDSPNHGFDVSGSRHTLRDSIFINGYFNNKDAFESIERIIQYSPLGNMDKIPNSTERNPQFTSVLPSINNPTFEQLYDLDFTANCDSCSGIGSDITSAHGILARIDSLNKTDP